MNLALYTTVMIIGVITVSVCSGLIYFNNQFSSYFLLYIILWFASFGIMTYLQFTQSSGSSDSSKKTITNCPDGWLKYIDQNNSTFCINNQYGSLITSPDILKSPSNASDINQCSIVSLKAINTDDFQKALPTWTQQNCKVTYTNLNQNLQ